VDIFELLALLAFADGLLLLALRRSTGAIALVAGLICVFVSRWRFIGEPRQSQSHKTTSYLSWITDKLHTVTETYNDRLDIQCCSPEAFSSYQQSPLSSQLPLTEIEFMLIQLLSRATSRTALELVSQVLSPDAITTLDLDGHVYTTANSVGRLLLALSTDHRFSILPIRQWIIDGRTFLFKSATVN
jgi:hypothetical protein